MASGKNFRKQQGVGFRVLTENELFNNPKKEEETSMNKKIEDVFDLSQ